MNLGRNLKPFGSPLRWGRQAHCVGPPKPETSLVWIALLASVLTVYVLTLAPGVLGGDPGELQFVPYILSISHPTGTPLYCLLGKVWSMLPLGPTVAWRMNLLAAVSAALAVALVYHCVYTCSVHLGSVSGRGPHTVRLPAGVPRPNPIPGLAAALSLAFGVTFWEQALMADKYAFNALMVALIIYLALRWGQTRSSATLNLLAFTYGLGLAHHRTMVLFAPALLGYVWYHERGGYWRGEAAPLREGPKSLLARKAFPSLLRLAALCLAPLLLYLYLPWAESRGLPPGTWHPRTVQEWYDYVFDTGRTGLVYVDPADLAKRLLFYARTLQRDFTWVGVVLGVGGLMRMFRRRRPDALFLLVNYVLQAFLAANHHVPRHWVYFIPSFVIFALWVGEGLTSVWLGIERLWATRVARGKGGVPRPRGHASSAGQQELHATLLAASVSAAMLVWLLVPFPGRYRPLRDAHLGAGVLDVWRQTLKQGHMGDRMGRAIANVEPNAVIVCDWEQATPLWYFQQVEGLRPDVQIVYPIERLDEAAGRGRPLYIARAHAGLADRWHPSCSDSLIALHPAPAQDFSGKAFPPDMLPLGIRLGRALGAQAALGANAGQPGVARGLLAVPSPSPLHGAGGSGLDKPTAWDRHSFELVGFAYGEVPSLTAKPTAWGRRAPSLGRQTEPRAEGSGEAFARHRAFLPAMVVPLTLYWRAIEAPMYDYSVSLRLFDESGGQVFQVDSQHPVLGTYPTSRWTPGEMVSDYYEIQLSPNLPPGTYRWGVILYRALPEGGWESLKVAGGDTEIAMGGVFNVRKRGLW